MAVVTMKELLQAGMHFGHQTRRWNPKMKRYILGERNGIYLLDLRQSLSGIEQSYIYIRDMVADGGNILFVGTKKQAQDAVSNEAHRVGMPYVNERWLGGLLTNFTTMSARTAKMRDLERRQRLGEFELMPKKEALLLTREMEKLQRYLGGIRHMERVPDALFVIDTKKEYIAVTEANRLGIPVVAIVDTNCDPDVIDFPIPGNDDAIRSTSLIARVIADAVSEGRRLAAHRGNASAVATEDVATPAANPEEIKRKAQEQMRARVLAQQQQKEREARLLEAKRKAKEERDAAEATQEDAEESSEPAEAPVAEAPAAAAEAPAESSGDESAAEA
ncbi:MAG: 30S ribosomal protein S2 [Acidimicrobiia bacterium]|nr:30S ribosomal protein S2 [Acidimicrobiia bacterium]MBP8181213.1 30S ribosomal protein S2 [Acidimicrobiia bacterium]